MLLAFKSTPVHAAPNTRWVPHASLLWYHCFYWRPRRSHSSVECLTDTVCVHQEGELLCYSDVSDVRILTSLRLFAPPRIESTGSGVDPAHHACHAVHTVCLLFFHTHHALCFKVLSCAVCPLHPCCVWSLHLHLSSVPLSLW